MSENPKNKFDYYLFKRVIKLARPYRPIMWLAVVLAVILAPLATQRPNLIMKMVDDHIYTGDFDGMGQLVMLLFGLLFAETIFRYLFIYYANLLGQSVIYDLRVRVFKHITRLRLTYFDRTPIGTSTTRTINDIETINNIFSQGVITIMADLLTIIFVLGFMFMASWQLTLICLTTLPLLVIATYIFKENVKKAFQIVRTQISKMNAFLQERISGMRIVQIFNAEEQEASKFKSINREYTQANLDSILYYAVFYPVVEILSAASLGLMVWWGAGGVINDTVSLGALVAFPIYLNMLFRPVRTLADNFNTLQMGLVAAERVFSILDRDDIIDNSGKIEVKELKGDIEFKHVDFSYVVNEPVLKDLSFSLNAGETLAIVGGTGSGKSTIVNVLNRFYPLNGGQILVDGHPYESYELSHYRNRIGMVLQDVFLFSGSVMENITLRDERFTKEEVIAASKLIGAHPFLEKLPGGYDYQVMERGATLSKGQRQLISFVRALIFDPDVLILDEATSSIDPETEAVIQTAIEKLIDKRTSIIIAHRLSTIRHADNILVLEKGEIAELGTHEELLLLEDGHYRGLYDMQFLETID